MINIGSNKFEKCAIPLIFEGRYFLVENVREKDVFTVFTIVEGNPVVEVLRNEPVQNPSTAVEKSPAGILTVSDPQSEEFLYKIRPGSKNSSIFGSIRGEETEVKIKDDKIEYRGNTFQSNMFHGVQVGIKIEKDGSMKIGTSFPPELLKLISK